MGRQGRAWGAGLLAVALTLAVIGLGAPTSGAATAPSTARERVSFSVVGSQPARAARLRRTARIIVQRYRALGARRVVAKVHGRTIAVTGVGVTQPAAAVARRARLTLRPVLAYMAPATTPPSEDPPGTILPALPATGASVRYQVGRVTLTNAGVRSVKAVDIGGLEGSTVIFSLTRRGLIAFNRLARELFPRQPPENSVAIVVDGVIQSAPMFQTANFNGDIAISAGFTPVEARGLAAVLRYGPLPVAVRVATPAG
jgi:preprotein translocase subunit SecD